MSVGSAAGSAKRQCVQTPQKASKVPEKGSKKDPEKELPNAVFQKCLTNLSIQKAFWQCTRVSKGWRVTVSGVVVQTFFRDQIHFLTKLQPSIFQVPAMARPCLLDQTDTHLVFKEGPEFGEGLVVYPKKDTATAPRHFNRGRMLRCDKGRIYFYQERAPKEYLFIMAKVEDWTDPEKYIKLGPIRFEIFTPLQWLQTDSGDHLVVSGGGEVVYVGGDRDLTKAKTIRLYPDFLLCESAALISGHLVTHLHVVAERTRMFADVRSLNDLTTSQQLRPEGHSSIYTRTQVIVQNSQSKASFTCHNVSNLESAQTHIMKRLYSPNVGERFVNRKWVVIPVTHSHKVGFYVVNRISNQFQGFRAMLPSMRLVDLGEDWDMKLLKKSRLLTVMYAKNKDPVIQIWNLNNMTPILKRKLRVGDIYRDFLLETNGIVGHRQLPGQAGSLLTFGPLSLEEIKKTLDEKEKKAATEKV